MTSVEDDDISDENGITVMGVLSTLQTILGLIEDHPEIIARVEPMVHGLILRILDAFASGLKFDKKLYLVYVFRLLR